MELIYACLLLHKAHKEINEANLKKVLDAAGISRPDGELKTAVAAFNGINIDEAIKEATAAQFVAPAAGAKAEEEKKKEPAEEKKSAEEAAAGLGSLFG